MAALPLLAANTNITVDYLHQGFIIHHLLWLIKASLFTIFCGSLPAAPCTYSNTEKAADGKCRCVAGFKPVAGTSGNALQCEGACSHSLLSTTTA
jgi:hypothetical protein